MIWKSLGEKAIFIGGGWGGGGFRVNAWKANGADTPRGVEPSPVGNAGSQPAPLWKRNECFG